MDKGIVIVGGGLAAASLAVAYREEGGDELVTIVSSDDRPPYNRPPLSKGFLRGEIEDEQQTFVAADRVLRRQRDRPAARRRGDEPRPRARAR